MFLMVQREIYILCFDVSSETVGYKNLIILNTSTSIYYCTILVCRCSHTFRRAFPVPSWNLHQCFMFQFCVKRSIQHCKYENQYRGEATHYWLNARIVFQVCDNVGKKTVSRRTYTPCFLDLAISIAYISYLQIILKYACISSFSCRHMHQQS